MEGKVELEQVSSSEKRAIFDAVINGVSLRVHNITRHLQITQPRRKVVVEETAEIYWKYVFLLKLDCHFRPGESYLSQLAWIKDGSKLDQLHLDNCAKHWRTYCTDPVSFLMSQENTFADAMADPWCFEQEDFNQSCEDFVSAYNKYYQLEIQASEINQADLEPAWRKSWHSKPEIEDLINSGFLVIRHAQP